MVEGEGFEPPKAEPADLQSAPVDRLGTPPKGRDCVAYLHALSISHSKVHTPGSGIARIDRPELPRLPICYGL